MLLQDGKLERSLKALHQSLELSSKLEEASGDVDVLGAIGDLYTDLGDLEKAGEVCKTTLDNLSVMQAAGMNC